VTESLSSKQQAVAPILQFDDVHKSFPAANGRVSVLHGIELSLAQGEFVAITGPSGSGKSTLLHLAALLDHATDGSIYFDSNKVDELSESELCEIRKYKVGMVFQKYCLLPHRSVLENVMFRFRYIEHDPAEAKQQSIEILQTMGLGDIIDRPARLLSGGEMQRVSIARAVVLRPRLLVADEPTGNLDSAATNLVMSCFKELNQQGLTILLVTHNRSLLQYCTRHLLCQDGMINKAG
jgi:ABC-type lipoprotein export system ATPase subunit